MEHASGQCGHSKNVGVPLSVSAVVMQEFFIFSDGVIVLETRRTRAVRCWESLTFSMNITIFSVTVDTTILSQKWIDFIDPKKSTTILLPSTTIEY